jgi:hypothetical protein
MKPIVSIAFLFLFAACTTLTKPPANPANTFLTTKTWVEDVDTSSGSCSFTDAAAIKAIKTSVAKQGGQEVLVGEVPAPQLLSELLSAFTAFAAERAKESDSNIYATSATNVFTIGDPKEILGCFTVVRAVYSDDPRNASTALQARGAVNPPLFAFQAALVAVGEDRYAFVPTYVSFAAAGAKRSSHDSKDVTVVINVEGLGTKVNSAGSSQASPQGAKPDGAAPKSEGAAAKPEGAAAQPDSEKPGSGKPDGAAEKPDSAKPGTPTVASIGSGGFVVSFPALKVGTTLRYVALRDYQMQVFTLKPPAKAVAYTASLFETEPGSDFVLGFSKVINDQNKKTTIESALADAIKKYLPSTASK